MFGGSRRITILGPAIVESERQTTVAWSRSHR